MTDRKSAIGVNLDAGAVTALVTLPEAMVYGAIVFAPLGPGYAAFGLMAGIVSLSLGNLLFLRGGNPIMVNSTLALTSVMLAAALALILAQLRSLGNPQPEATALVLLFLVVFFAGLVQVLAGLLKMGELSRFVPRQVISGMINGVSLLILLSQVPVLLGLPINTPLREVLSRPEQWRPANILAGVVTILLVVYGGRLKLKVLPIFSAILAGTAVFYALYYLTGELPGKLLQPLESGLPFPTYGLEFLTLDAVHWEQFAPLLPYVLGVALLASLWSLLFMGPADELLGHKSDGNRELLNAGFSNMLIACFGGVTVAGHTNTTVNFNHGATGWQSRLSCGLTALAILCFLGPALGYMPTVVLSGVLIGFSVQALDNWSLKMLRIAVNHRHEARGAWVDLAVMLAVVLCMLTIGVLEAVAAGVLFSLVIFIRRMGTEIIRADLSSADIISNALRSREEREVLELMGDKIRVIEIEGALFFGTADNVAIRLAQTAREGIEYIVLDMRRITEVDATGAEMLLKVNRNCAAAGQVLLLSGIDWREADNAFLRVIGALDAFEGRYFVYLNDAVRQAEDQLLDRHLGVGRYQVEIPFSDLDALAMLDADERKKILHWFEVRNYNDGDRIFRENDIADAIYILARGRVEIRVRVPEIPDKTIVTVCPGVLFGELALQGLRRRYGTAYANGETRCYRLSQAAIAALQDQAPALCYKLIAGISTSMADRMAGSARAMASKLYV